MERYPFLPLQAHVVTHTFRSIVLALHMPYALRGYVCRQGQAQSLSRSRGVQQALVLVLLAQDASAHGLLIQRTWPFRHTLFNAGLTLVLDLLLRNAGVGQPTSTDDLPTTPAQSQSQSHLRSPDDDSSQGLEEHVLYAIQALDDSCRDHAPVRDAPWVEEEQEQEQEEEDLQSNPVPSISQDEPASFSGQRLQQLLLLAMQRHALTGDGVTTVDKVMQAYSTNLIGQRAKQLNREQQAAEQAGRTVTTTPPTPTSTQPSSSGFATTVQPPEDRSSSMDSKDDATLLALRLGPTTPTTVPPPRIDPVVLPSTSDEFLSFGGDPDPPPTRPPAPPPTTTTDSDTNFDPLFTPEVLDQLLTELTQDQAGLSVQALLDDPFLTGGTTHVHGHLNWA